MSVIAKGHRIILVLTAKLLLFSLKQTQKLKEKLRAGLGGKGMKKGKTQGICVHIIIAIILTFYAD